VGELRMTVSEDHEKQKKLRRSAKTILRNALIRTLIPVVPVFAGGAIMFFFRSRVGVSFGFFAGGLMGVVNLVLYFQDRKEQNVYYTYYTKFERTSRLIAAILFVMMMWGAALYVLLQ
jgi:hypothetical protein